jgi:hypothetical protein
MLRPVAGCICTCQCMQCCQHIDDILMMVRKCDMCSDRQISRQKGGAPPSLLSLDFAFNTPVLDLNCRVMCLHC